LGFGLIPTSEGAAVSSVLFPSTDNAEQGMLNYCESSAGVPSYACALQIKALVSYRRGMLIAFWADVPCNGGCTLKIDQNNPESITQSNGTTTAIFAAGPHILVNDGTVFRILL
jgi:hypothetical protein